MEDPLRPKPIPLSEETVLWFEFLLDPALLTRHLKKPAPEPTTLELLSQFISTAPDIEAVPNATEGLNISRKQLGRKILALKVATWLKWNLDVMEKNLPVPEQLYLLRDLCTLSFGKLMPVPLPADINLQIGIDGNENASRFALTIYHRWVVRRQLLKDIAHKYVRPPILNMFALNESMYQLFAPDISPQTSIDFLLELCQSTETFYVLDFDNFVLLHFNMEETKQNFEHMVPISHAELRAQVYFDLVNFYLFTKQYVLATNAVNECHQNLQDCLSEYDKLGKTQKDFRFCHFDSAELEGLLLACGKSRKVSLMERFNQSQLEFYKDIVEILKEDNNLREIPYESRRIIEWNIEGAISQGLLTEPRTLEMHVAALNIVRGIFEAGNIFLSVDYFEKYAQMDCFSVLLDCIVDVLPQCSTRERDLFKDYLIECVLKQPNSKPLFQALEKTNLFEKSELEDLELQIKDEDIFLPALGTLPEWKFNSKLTRIEISSLERQLISCTNANSVRKLLVKLAGTNPTKPLWTVNPSWELATPIKSIIMAIHPGFLQDFSYVLLGKAREMTAKKDYVGAVSMLSVLKSETQRQELSNTSIVGRLGKLVTWEILLIQITQCFDEWTYNSLDLQSLGTRCKQCLGALQNGDNIIPRIEIIESCAYMLLNLNDFHALMFLDKRLPQLELPIAFAATFLDMEKMKGKNKICRDAWEILLSMFLNMKRSGNQGNSRSSPSLSVSTGLQPFLKRIRHQALFSLVISALGKILNILRDDPNHDLNGEYMQLWPTSISNPIGYSMRSVSETLHWLLTEALKYYPQTIAWLKMKGDLELAIGNNEAAMRCYVNALITATDYCTRNIADDYVIRKMIRCSANLGCHMQATVLCQFLDEIDYGIVFKNLAEKSPNYADAMDAYYNCIWDTTLLEFIINLHAKKGEHSRKLEAMAIMGTLELNANNNDEIKREAASIRKTRFVRALAKQYLL